MNFVKIECINKNATKEYPIGTDMMTIAVDQNVQLNGGILGVYVNNKIQELNFTPIRSSKIRFFGLESPDGCDVYSRGLFFTFYAAVHDLFPDYKVVLEYPTSSGMFCTATKGKQHLDEAEVKTVEKRMRQMIEADIPINRIDMPTDEAIKMFEQQGLYSKRKLLHSRGTFYTSVYSLGSTIDYFYGFLPPSTGCLKVFEISTYKKGIVISVPDENENFLKPKKFMREEKILSNLDEYNRWQTSFRLDNVGELNASTINGNISEVIKVTEANQEVKIHLAAAEIKKASKKVKVILLAGPSSSGKTTSAQRLIIHLQVLGIRCHKLSLDDYFFERDKTPKDENGDYDFETIKAVDVDFFNEQLNDLMSGKEVSLPHFDFITGKRTFNGQTLKLQKNDMVVVEGIHGLNPDLTPGINPENLYKIFVSALTTISLDDHNIIPSSDNRLIRRIVRDKQFRGYSAEETILRWPKVREGEKKYIEPFQENADFMFNSSLFYELGVLKSYVLPLLANVPETSTAFSEAYRLSKFMSYFEAVSVEEIPPTSLMREFLGGSSFKY